MIVLSSTSLSAGAGNPIQRCRIPLSVINALQVLLLLLSSPKLTFAPLEVGLRGDPESESGLAHSAQGRNRNDADKTMDRPMGFLQFRSRARPGRRSTNPCANTIEFTVVVD